MKSLLIDSVVPLSDTAVLVVSKEGAFWRVTIPNNGNECYWQKLKNVLMSEAFESKRTTL